VRDAIANDNRGEIRRLLEGARTARNRIPAKVGLAMADLFEVTVTLPDRPGGAAGVMTLVGNEGVNIEDFQLVHSAEGGQGLFTLVIAGEHNAERARSALQRAGYAPRVHRL
jgi:prephenate dehydrogenase